MLYSGKGRHSLKNVRPCIFFSIEFFAYAKNSTYPFPVRASCPLSLPKNKSFIRSDTRSGTLDVTDVSAGVSLTKLALKSAHGGALFIPALPKASQYCYAGSQDLWNPALFAILPRIAAKAIRCRERFSYAPFARSAKGDERIVQGRTVLLSSAAKKILHKRSAASAGECFEAAFFRSGFVQPLSFNCFTDFVFWV